MAAKKKTVRKAFGYRQCDDFAAYLNHMARQGWHFQEWRAGLVFREGPPEEAHYAVEIFSQAEETDIRPEPNTREFAEYCEAAGWQFVDSLRKYCVFKRIRSDAVPIMTDEERFEAVSQSERPTVNRALGLSFLWVLLKTFELVSLFEMRIFDSLYVSITSLWFLLFVLALLRWGQFQLWKSLCRKQLDRGEPLFFGRSRRANSERWYDALYSVALLAHLGYLAYLGQSRLILYPLIIYGIVAIMGFLLAWFRPDSNTNSLIQIIVTILLVLGVLTAATLDTVGNEQVNPAAEPPLTFADMGYDLSEPEIAFSYADSSVFGTSQRAQLRQDGEYVSYSLYFSNHPWVLRKLWKEETKGKANETRTDCTAAWGAVEAFRNNAGEYLVRYKDAIWTIRYSFEEPLTQEQINSIIAALRGD